MITDTHWSKTEEPIGPVLKKVIETGYKSCVEEQDHYPLLTLGPTNSGKSHLNLWFYETIHHAPEIWRVCWTRDEFARVQARVAREVMPRYVFYDELDAESKEAMSRWNKAFKRLFDKVRYSNIFWGLVNPSVRYIDRSLVEDEVIKSLIVVRDKNKNRPREILLYTIEDLTKMLDKGEQLTLRNLRSLKTARRYAYLRSWFREYTGVLRDAYDKKKAGRTMDIHDMFAQEHGSQDALNLAQAARVLRVHRNTLAKYVRRALEEGRISEPNVAGTHKLVADDIEVLRSMILEVNA